MKLIKNSFYATALSLCALSFSHSVFAGDHSPKFSVGLKVGMLTVSDDLSEELSASGVDLETDSDTVLGFKLGYNFTPNWSVEFEAQNGTLTTEVTSGNVTGKSELDITTTALFAAYRSSGDLYFMGKIGVLNETIDFSYESGPNLGDEEISDSGLSLGIGGGYRISDSFSLEAEYSFIDTYIDFVGVTAALHF